MLALLLLAPAFTDMLTRRATHSAVAKHGGAGSIPAGPLFRRVMRDLGTDLSRRNSDRLLALYAKNVSHITVDEIASIIDLSHSASPSKHFWLRVDPDDNGIRETRPKWNRFAQAGLGSADRIAHYAVGLAALAVGAIDLVDFVRHTGVCTLSATDAYAHGCVHTLAAFLSLTRFQYRWDAHKPFHLWMPTAREANMWPTFLVYTWYTLGFVSDFVCERDAALVAFSSPQFQALTWLATGAILYGTARTVLETDEAISGVYSTRLSNTLQVIGLMGIPITADSVKCLLVAHEPYYTGYTDLVSRYPVYTQIYTGAFLTAMFLGNLACALSSAEHHRAIHKSQIGDFINALTALVTCLSVFAMVRVENGAFAFEMAQLVWRAMLGA